MTWPSMLAHLWWATAVAVTCAIEPIVPVAAIVCGTVLLLAQRDPEPYDEAGEE